MATNELKKEYAFEGTTLNGFLMLFVTLVLLFGSIAMAIWGGIEAVPAAIILAVILFITGLIFCGGFLLLEPNEARVCCSSESIREHSPARVTSGCIHSSQPRNYRSGHVTSTPNLSR